MFSPNFLKELLYILPAVVVSLTFHEFSHALIATRLGDPTPRQTGRLSLNPIRHIDPFGFIVMILVRFGWAKPVQVNPLYFKKPKKGMMLTALAGPVMNLALCVVASLMQYFSLVLGLYSAIGGQEVLSDALEICYRFLMYMVYLNIGLAIFNLIPVHPLDGSRILSYFVPSYAELMRNYGQYVQLGFMLLLILPGFLPIPDIIGTAIYSTQKTVSIWLYSLWESIFGLLT